MTSIGRICNQQQSIFGNEDISFMANYRRKLRMGTDIRKKGKMEKVIEFVERMKKVQEKAGVALRKMQEEMKQQADRGRIKEKE